MEITEEISKVVHKQIHNQRSFKCLKSTQNALNDDRRLQSLRKDLEKVYVNQEEPPSNSWSHHSLLNFLKSTLITEYCNQALEKLVVQSCIRPLTIQPIAKNNCQKLIIKRLLRIQSLQNDAVHFSIIGMTRVHYYFH